MYIEAPEVEFKEGVISECCGARVTEMGICEECKEHAE